MKTPTEKSLELITRNLEKLTVEVRLLRKTVAEHGIALFPGLVSDHKEDEITNEEKDDSDFLSALL